LGTAVDINPTHTLQKFWTALDSNVTPCLVTIFSWYLPKQAWFIVPAGLAVAVAAIIFSRTARGRLVVSTKAILRRYSPAVILFVTYVFVLLSLLAARMGVIEERYLSTVYISATLILFELVVRLFGPTDALRNSKAKRGLVALMALWLCFPVTQVAQATARRFKDGAGEFSTTRWHESEIVSFARQMLSGINTDVHVYSNGPDVLQELAGVNAIMSPRRTASDLTELRGHWPAEDVAYLLWFKRFHRWYLFSVAELTEVANVVEVAHLSDGSIYLVRARGRAAQDPNP
jgi:hypothetical protein